MNTVFLFLQEENGMQFLSVPTDVETINSIKKYVAAGEKNKDTLPAVMWKLLMQNDDRLLQIKIDSIENGMCKCSLFDMFSRHTYELQPSDAVLLSIISRMPIYIEHSLFIANSIVPMEDNAKMVLPISQMNDTLLRKALDKAVESENYEQASKLQEELNRRKQNKQ